MFVALMYHIVDGRIDAPIAVSEDAFAAQLEHLRSEGYAALTLAEVLEIVGGAEAPERGVHITFDDAYADNLYAALPRLREHGLEATLFVPTAYVGETNDWNELADYEVRHLNWSELERWVDGGGRVGGHTHEHRSASESTPDQLRVSIELNRRLLQDRLGAEVDAFAYPYGIATAEARAEVARRYKVAWVVGGGTWDPSQDPFRLNRFEVDGRLGLLDFGRGLEALFEPRAEPRRRMPPQPNARRPDGPGVALVLGASEAPGYQWGVHFAALLESGWDAHVVRSSMRALDRPGIVDLGHDVLRSRVHPPPRTLQSRPPRRNLVTGLLEALRRHPVRTVRALAGAKRHTRYLHAVLFALDPALVHFESEEEASELSRAAAALDARILVGPQGVPPVIDRSLLDLDLPVLPRSGGPLRVLAAGPWTWQSGYEHVLDALRLLEARGVACECRIVGSGEQRHALEAAREQLGLEEALELRPPCGRPEFLAQLRWADVVVNPAVVATRPPWLLDAYAAGRPVLTTHLPSEDHEPALTVPRRDAEALAAALRRLASEPELGRRLGEAGRQHARERPAIDDQLARFRDLYRRVLDG